MLFRVQIEHDDLFIKWLSLTELMQYLRVALKFRTPVNIELADGMTLKIFRCYKKKG